MSEKTLLERVDALTAQLRGYLADEVGGFDAVALDDCVDTVTRLAQEAFTPEPSWEEPHLCPVKHGAEHDMELVWYCETCGHREPAKAPEPSREGVGREIYGRYGSVIGHTNGAEPSREELREKIAMELCYMDTCYIGGGWGGESEEEQKEWLKKADVIIALLPASDAELREALDNERTFWEDHAEDTRGITLADANRRIVAIAVALARHEGGTP